MNCAECRENLVAFVEGLIDGEASLQCQAHLETCAACRAEHTAIFRLQRRLVARGQAAAEVSLVEPVMQRVFQEQTEPERNTIMSLLRKHRWGFGLGAAATAAAAVIISIVVATSPKAFGIEQVIEAYNKIRFLHVKTFGAKAQEPAEFWIQSNDQGQVEKARYYLPETEDGAKLITWTPERTELWFKNKRVFVTLQTKRIAPWMQSLLEQSQPQSVMKKLLEGQKAGQVNVDMQKPPGTQEPGVIVVTYTTAPKKEVYRIDPKTDLISRVEYYRIEGANEVLESRTEYSDYNVPIEEKVFSIRGELPKDVRIADQLNQVVGVAQGNMTDEQAAAETVRQFFQALIDKDYKKVGLIQCGELEVYAKKEFGAVNVAQIVSIGPPVPQPDWDKHGFRVPCELEIIHSDGQKSIWKSSPYVRPGDDEMRPDRWNITGGVNPRETEIRILPDNAKYENMTPQQAAEAFFKACAEQNWDECLKFWQMSGADGRFERMKEYLGGLEIVSIGEPYKSGKYPGWYVPYEIKLRPQVFNVRMANTNAAKRYVITGIYDSKLQLREELKWTNEPQVPANNDAYARMTPVEAAKAYFHAASKFDWAEMRKFVPDNDVEKDKRQLEEAEKQGMDVRKLMPATEVVEVFWSAEQSAWFVKCHMSPGIKKHNLALRKDNPAGRWQVDGGI
jgi:hypothetical protein